MQGRAHAPATALLLLGACVGDPVPPPAGDPEVGVPADLGLRPLTRAELDHAVQDLLGVELFPSELLPEQARTGYPTDVRGGAVDGLLVERMLEAAAATADALDRAAPLHAVRIEAEDLADDWDMALDTSDAAPRTWVGAFGPRTLRFPVTLAVDGEWRVTVYASVFIDDFFERELLADPLTVRATIDGAPLPAMVLREQGTDARPFVHVLPLAAGAHRVELTLETSPGQYPILDAVGFTPADEAPTLRTLLAACDGLQPAPRTACVVDALVPLARRAWRRPVDPERRALLDAIAADSAARGGDAAVQGRHVIEAVLASPDFWFVIEGGRGPSLGPRYRLSSHEVAARLALFLWQSVPDDALLDCADAGGLGATADECGLSAQVDRLLADARAARLVDGFAVAWLGLDRLDVARPDPAVFPELDDALVAALREEARRVIEEVFFHDLPLHSLVSADFTWVDATVARHYGLPAPQGTDFVRIATDPAVRGGALRSGAVLLSTAHPARPSDVRRGELLLGALGCDPVSAPPANIPAFDPEAGVLGLLDQTDAPMCIGCHADLNPWGLALSAYDIAGRHAPEAWVDVSDRGYPLHFEAFHALAEHLRRDDLATRCFARHLASWAASRGLTQLPEDALLAVEQATLRGGGTLRAAVHAVVASEPFLTRPGVSP